MTIHGNKSHIRKAEEGDAARIGAIARSAYGKYVPRIGREPAPMGTDFGAEIAAHRVVVVGADDRVFGYMVAWPEVDAYFIEDIAVDPIYQSTGLGRRLIEHAVTEAKSLRLPALRLYTNEAMTENLSLYTRIGFVETHRAVENGFHRVYMRWDLLEGER